MPTDFNRINLLPLSKGAISYEEYTDFINLLALVLRWISPLVNNMLGQIVPQAEYLRDGHLAYADGVNWNPTSPQYANVYGGNVMTTGVGDTETFTITGITTSDIPMVFIKTQGTNPVMILRYACMANGIEVTFSSNPGNDHILNYLVFRNTGKGFYYYDTSSGGSWRKVG